MYYSETCIKWPRYIGPLHSGLYREVVFEYTDTFGTSQSGLLIQVISEYRWPLTQVSLALCRNLHKWLS